MANFINSVRIRDFCVAGLVLAVAIAIGGNETQGTTPDLEDGASKHTFSTPGIQPSIANGCSAEAAAYAQALVDMQAASDAADDAYAAWYDCIYGTGSHTTQEIPESPSILVRD